MVEEHIQALELFNRKADKLDETSFVDKLEENKFSWRWERGEGAEMERSGPTEEQIDAFVLTYRFFIQDNEDSSFRELAERYKEMPVSDEHRERFFEARSTLNEFLDTELNFTYNGDTPTRREVMNTFIYGNLAHENNPEHVERYNFWAESEYSLSIFRTLFVGTLGNILNLISHVRAINEDAIAELRQDNE